MAYRAEIQIGVVGIGQLGTLQKSLNQVSKTVDLLNTKKIEQGFNIQNLNTYNAQLQKAWQNINKAAMGSQEELKAVQDLVKAKNNQIAAQERLNKLLAQAAAEQRKIVATENAGFGVQGPRAAGSRGSGRAGGPTSPIGGRADLPGSPAALKAASEAQSKLFENLALGAGFPLLFGGGPGQVLGGLAGSFVGTGFGGQILGSAIGGQLEALGVAASQAGAALQKPIDNFNIIEQRALLASSSQEKYVKNLIDAGQYIEATAAVQKRYNEVVGTEGSKNLLNLAAQSDKLNRAWSELSLQIQAALAGPLAGLLNWVANLIQRGNDIRGAGASDSQLTPQQRQEIQSRREALQRGRQRGTLFGGLTPQQAIKEEQAIANRVKQFRAQNQPAAQADLGFQATEAAQTASLERRREIQAQITKLREAELSSAQKQLQLDVTLLSKQLEFATSLNQQSAIIDKIAAKKVESANAEYQLVQRQQQTAIINAKLALETAQAKAKAAQAELDQAAATNKQILPARKQELETIIAKVPVAEKELATTQQVAGIVTQRAQKERETAVTLTDIEKRQQKIAAFTEESARQIERFDQAAQLSLNALDNNLKVIDAYSQAQTTINNLEIQSLQNKLTQATTDAERYTIIDEIRKLEISNAAITLQATRAQIAAEVERQRIAMSMAALKYKELQAQLLYAQSQGPVNQKLIDAVNAQRQALQIAQANYETSQKVANEQYRAADAVYNAAVNAANLKINLEGSASAAGAIAGSMERAASASGAAGGRGFSLGFGAAGSNAFFMKSFQDEIKALNERSKEMGMNAAQKAYSAILAKYQELAQSYNQRVAQENLASAREEFYAGSSPRESAMQRFTSSTPTQTTMGAGVSPQVSITTGPVMQMDGTNYVTQRDLVSATGAAARQGANMALQMLQNNPAARRRTGVTQ